MCFEIYSVPKIFQKWNQKLFRDTEGVEVYDDIIIIVGSVNAAHDIIMPEILERSELNLISKFKLIFR